MAVYVDNARLTFRNMRMCHMIADTIEELHAMADRLGLKRAWFQYSATHPHYDLSLSKRELAIQFGAHPLTSKELVMVLRKNAAYKEHTCHHSLPSNTMP